MQGLGEIKARDIDNGKWNVPPPSALPPVFHSILFVRRLLVVHSAERVRLVLGTDADDAAALCQK